MARRLTGGIQKRPKGWLWVYYYDPRGERRWANPETKDRRAAQSFLAQINRSIADGTWIDPRGEQPQRGRFAADWEAWLATRKDVKTLAVDRRDGRLHILPYFGERATADITYVDVLDFLEHLRGKESARGRPLAKNTIRCVGSRLATFFRYAKRRELTTHSPFGDLESHERPQAATRHELEDVKRVFTEAEVIALMSDERLALDRRVLYGLQFFTGTRFGEASGLRWSDWDESEDTIAIKRQYKDKPLKGKRGRPGPPRMCPVHPELRRILDEWRREGFPMLFGREPEPSDYIVPSMGRGRRGTRNCRSLRCGEEGLYADLERLGLAPTGQTHAFRRAFKTIAVGNDAAEVWIERIIHNAGGGVAGGT